MVLWFDPVLLQHIERRENDEAQLILKSADNPYNLIDSSGNSLLHYAAKYGNQEMVKYLIDSGTFVDIQNKDGETPCILAMKHCNTVEVPEVLLDANANINVCDKAGNSPLQLAVSESINCRLWRKISTKLETQFSFNYEEITELITKFGGNLLQAMFLSCVEVTKIMLKQGYSVHETDYEGRTPLHYAVGTMQLENVKLLVEHEANVNQLDNDGLAPLYFFDPTAHDNAKEVLQILKILMDAGAKMAIPEEPIGQTIQMKWILMRGSKAVIRLLMKYDIDLNTKYENGYNALLTLALNMNPGVLKELYGKSFDVNVQNDFQGTLIDLATGNPSSVKFLLDHGANVNVYCADGITTLFMVPYLTDNPINREIHLENIMLFLQYGVDIETVDPDGLTIFDAAVENDNLPLIEPVLAHLAMLKVSGKPLPPLANERIDVYQTMKNRLDFYMKKIEKMKTVTVFQSITLYNLLIEDENKIAVYMRNEKLLLKISRLSNKCGLTSYYHKCLRKRLTKAIQIAKLKEGAAIILCKIISQSYSANFIIIDKIIDYLDYEDMKSLHYVY